MGKKKRTRKVRHEETSVSDVLAAHLIDTSRLSLSTEQDRGAGIARLARTLTFSACVFAVGVLIASAVLAQLLVGWERGVLAIACAVDVVLLLATIVVSLGAQTVEGHVHLGSPKDFGNGLAALLRSKPEAGALDAAEMLCSSLNLVFRDLRETNDGRRAAVRTASALFYAAVGVVVVMVILLCVLFFIAG
jgi:hypothetical protein